MFLIYNFSISRIFQRLFAELFRNLVFQFGDQSLFSFFITVNKIRGHAGLPAVQKFSKYDASGSKGEISTVIHQTRTLSAKFQSDRSQMHGSLLHDLTADRFASGKENIVEMLLQQSRIFCSAARDHRDILCRKIL